MAPEPPSGWHEQGWLLVLEALDHYTREHTITEGQKLRAYQLVELIVRLHSTVSLGVIQRQDLEHFEQYARHE